MEYRITPSSRGGFTVSAGCVHRGGESNPTGCPGMKATIATPAAKHPQPLSG